MAQPQLPPNPVSAGLSPAAGGSRPAALPPNPVGGSIGAPAPAPTKSGGGGGGIGGFFHHVTQPFTSAGHYIAHKASLAGHDIKAIPGGVYDLGKTGSLAAWYTATKQNDKADPYFHHLKQIGEGQLHVLEHPLRDPFATALSVLPIGHGLARGAAGAIEGGAVLRAGEGVGAAARAARAPKILSDSRSLTAPGGEPVSLAASRNALRRIYQQAHDTYVQHQVNSNPEGIVAKYGASRVGGSLSEVSRAKVRYKQAIVSNLRRASQPIKGEIVKAAKAAGIRLENDPKTIGQAAIELVSHNTLPDEAIIRAEHAIENGVNPELNQANLQLYHEIQGLDLVHNKGLYAEINPAFAKTATAESILNHGATSLDQQIAERNLRPADQLEARRDLPAAVTQRLKPFEGDKATPALRTARAEFERIDRAYQKSLSQEADWRNGNGQKSFEGARVTRGPNETPGVPEHSNPYRNRVVKLGIRHEAALERVQKLEARAGITHATSVPEDLQARTELLNFAKEKFGAKVANERIGLLDRRAAQFARENDVAPTEFYRRFLKHVEAKPTLEHLDSALNAAWGAHEFEAMPHAAADGKASLANLEADNKLLADKPEAQPAEDEPLASSEGGAIHGSYEPQTATMRFSQEHAIPETVTHEALHAIRQSLPELLQRKFDRRYGVVDGQWSRAQEERFVEDMSGVAHGTIHDPELVRNFHQLTAMLPGKSFTPLKTLTDFGPHSPLARSQSPVVGLATDPLESHFTSGKGLLEGRHQEDVVDAVARHWHNVFRFFNTQDWRNLITKTGSDVRRSSRDILVREDNRTEGGAFQPKAVGAITPEIEKLIGRKRDTAYTPQMEGEEAGVLASVEQFVTHLFPGRDAMSSEAELERTAPEGTKAPTGYKWVDSETARVNDLVPRQPSTGFAKHVGNFFDNVNGAVTAATVYFKIGHFGTRYLTNAATNIMQGSANPLALREAIGVWHELSPEERLHALSTAGTHYYEALPGAEGTSRISRMIQHGVTPGTHAMSPQWWAGYVDAPFRFNSLAHEVRKSAYGSGTEAFRKFLGDTEGYNDLDPAQRAEVDGVVRRANREAIAYDRMNDFERRYLARGVWFYPWVKGSTVWTASALFEHPFKSAAAVAAGVHGRETQEHQIGDVPSYSYGVFLLAHGEPFPLAADFSTFNPMATAGDVLQIPEHASDAAGMLNPVLGSVDQVIHSQDQFGNHTNHPVSEALRGLVGSTPESQALTAIKGAKGDQSHREYPAVPGDPFSKTWIGEVLRGLIGPGAPRRINPEAAHSLAERERKGR